MSVNLEMLQNLSMEDLQHLSKEQIVDSIQVVLTNDGDTCSAFEFAFTQFPNVLTLSEINELICKQILPHLIGKYDEAIACIDCQDEDSIMSDEFTDVIETILQLFLGLSKSIHEKLDDTDDFYLSHIELHLLNTFHFLCKILPHTFLCSHDQIKPWLDAMQTSVTQLLMCQKLKVNTSLDELKTYRKVLKALVQLGNQQSHRNDVKSMANTWKHLSKLAIDFRIIYSTLQQQQNCTELNDISEDFLDWIGLCIDNICKLITSNVQKFLQHTKGTKESMAITKLTTFYLKLLESLAKEYPEEDFRGHNQFISLYEMTMDIANNCEDNDTKSYLLLINNGLSNVLSNIFNCDRFSNELLSNFHANHIQTCVEISKILLKSNITSNNWYLNHEDTQHSLLHHLFFVCIPKEIVKMYTVECLYDDIVILCALLISTVTNQWKILLEATLVDDARHLTILMDIWALYLRNESDATRSVYCRLWLDIGRNLSSIPRNPLNIFIQNLLKYTMSLLSDSHRSEILQELAENDLPTLALLGSNCATNGEVPNLQQYGYEIVNQIKQTLAKLDPKTDIVTSNECLELMTAFSSVQTLTSPHLMRIINDEQLINCLTDALSRSKTRCIDLLLASILSVLLRQKYVCRNNSVEIDYSDSADVQKFYALELISLAQMIPDRMNINVSTVLHSIEDSDDLIQVRIEKTIHKPQSKMSTENYRFSDQTTEYLEYFRRIFENKRQFGCTTLESCLNQSAVFKRSFEQIIQEVKKVETAYENNPHMNLTKFSHEIFYLSDFFNRLQALC